MFSGIKDMTLVDTEETAHSDLVILQKHEALDVMKQSVPAQG